MTMGNIVLYEGNGGRQNVVTVFNDQPGQDRRVPER